jgi:hypothetical protein
MIGKIPFMLRLSKHSLFFFSNLLVLCATTVVLRP